MALVEGVLSEIKQMSPEAQSKTMFDLASNADTTIGRIYTSLRVNTKLGFWYELGQLMKQARRLLRSPLAIKCLQLLQF